MTFRDMIRRSVIESFTGSSITTSTVVVTLGMALLLGVYIFAVYYFATRKTFYNKTFNVSLTIIAVITASIVLTMQSNLAISLGMVGALSIVRFRTAIKDPKDLMFLFWAISVGIICGGGVYEIAIIASLVVTIVMFVLELLPVGTAGQIIVINTKDPDAEKEVMEIIKKGTKHPMVRSRNLSVNGGADIIIDGKANDPSALMKELKKLSSVTGVSILDHDGEVNF